MTAEGTEHTHPAKPSSGWREFEDGQWEGSGDWQSYSCKSVERAVMFSTCHGPHMCLCRNITLRQWPGTSPPLCEGPMLVAFLLGGSEAEQTGPCSFCGGWACSAQNNVHREEAGLSSGNAAPWVMPHWMTARGHIAAHVCLKNVGQKET